MEWYYWLLIGLFSLSLISTSIYAWKEAGKYFFKSIPLIILVTLGLFILSPILFILSFIMFMDWIDRKKYYKTNKITKFNLGKIDEDVEAMLISLGFLKGTFESFRLNRIYEGFHKYKFEITLDGKGMFFGNPNKEEIFLIETLKKLKTKEKRLEILEDKLKYEKNFKEEKEKNIKNLTKEIKELKKDEDKKDGSK